MLNHAAVSILDLHWHYSCHQQNEPHLVILAFLQHIPAMLGWHLSGNLLRSHDKQKCYFGLLYQRPNDKSLQTTKCRQNDILTQKHTWSATLVPAPAKQISPASSRVRGRNQSDRAVLQHSTLHWCQFHDIKCQLYVMTNLTHNRESIYSRPEAQVTEQCGLDGNYSGPLAYSIFNTCSYRVTR